MLSDEIAMQCKSYNYGKNCEYHYYNCRNILQLESSCVFASHTTIRRPDHAICNAHALRKRHSNSECEADVLTLIVSHYGACFLSDNLICVVSDL